MEKEIKRGSIVRLKSDIVSRGFVVATVHDNSVSCMFYDEKSDDFVYTDNICKDVLDDITDELNNFCPTDKEFNVGDVVMLRTQPNVKMLFTVGKVYRNEEGKINRLMVCWKNNDNFYKCSAAVPQSFKKVSYSEGYIFLKDMVPCKTHDFVVLKDLDHVYAERSKKLFS